MRVRWLFGALAIASGVWILGTVASGAAPIAGPRKWSARELHTVKGFRVPECALVRSGGSVLVSNIDSDANGYWADDGVAAISLLDPDGTVKELRWIQGTPTAALNAPKGMCILRNVLYVADNTRVARYELRSGKPLEAIAVPDAKHLNDMASDGESAYVSDTAGNAIYRLEGTKPVRVPSPESPNGITFGGGGAYAVSWDLHDVYELDPAGQEEPVALGLAESFENPDGIEALPGGSLVVSDFTANKVVTISPDRTTVQTLVEIESPADIGLDRERGILWVPQFMKDTVVAYQLSPW
jgi:DNA-binding beta-propeller fold protein YncE